MEYAASQIKLRGMLLIAPEYSHENHGKTFYRLLLEVPRLSGTSDILPVIAEESQLSQVGVPGDTVTVLGQVRSHNIRTDGKRHLLIFVFATSIYCDDGEPINDCILEGFLCREPIYRRTPLGREICDIMLAVPRTFRRADYLPCIFWGRTARQIAECHTKDRISIVGRLQSRVYTKLTETGSEKRTAYEISVLSAQLLPELETQYDR